MRSAIMQPTYMPWIGYFDLIDQVDTFVFYDDVQLTKRSWQVRNKIKSINKELWLTLPIKKTEKRDSLLIKSSLLNNSENWSKKHLLSIELNYKKSPFFDEIFSEIIFFYKNANNLSELTSGIIVSIAEKIGCPTNFVFSSDLIGIEGQKDERLINICNAIKCDTYLSTQGSSIYINEKNIGGEFVNSNVKLYYHNYVHPTYPQFKGEFIPYLGIYDLLFNVGWHDALKFIRMGRQPVIDFDKLIKQ